MEYFEIRASSIKERDLNNSCIQTLSSSLL